MKSLLYCLLTNSVAILVLIYFYFIFSVSFNYVILLPVLGNFVTLYLRYNFHCWCQALGGRFLSEYSFLKMWKKKGIIYFIVPSIFSFVSGKIISLILRSLISSHTVTFCCHILKYQELFLSLWWFLKVIVLILWLWYLFITKDILFFHLKPFSCSYITLPFFFFLSLLSFILETYFHTYFLTYVEIVIFNSDM